mmetsp:Transcript_9253/g.13530  ORF Transcript_9253/g.13530 Transcript_9253/m.13530 type:complete len:80 (-) Transcript_9253:960-1199(-)
MNHGEGKGKERLPFWVLVGNLLFADIDERTTLRATCFARSLGVEVVGLAGVVFDQALQDGIHCLLEFLLISLTPFRTMQ